MGHFWSDDWKHWNVSSKSHRIFSSPNMPTCMRFHDFEWENMKTFALKLKTIQIRSLSWFFTYCGLMSFWRNDFLPVTFFYVPQNKGEWQSRRVSVTTQFMKHVSECTLAWCKTTQKMFEYQIFYKQLVKHGVSIKISTTWHIIVQAISSRLNKYFTVFIFSQLEQVL